MKAVLDFLKGKVFYLATVDGDQPHVRPLGLVFEYEGAICLGTGNFKDMYKQIVKNPKVEITCVDAQNNTLRVTAKAVRCTSEASQKKVFDVSPGLSGRYAVGDGRLEVLRLEDVRAYVQGMDNSRKVLI